MTTSNLYHTQGIRDYKYQKTERAGDTEIYYLNSNNFIKSCSCCKSEQISVVKTGKTRDIRGLFIGLKKRLCGFLLGRFVVKVVEYQSKKRFRFAQEVM